MLKNRDAVIEFYKANGPLWKIFKYYSSDSNAKPVFQYDPSEINPDNPRDKKKKLPSSFEEGEKFLNNCLDQIHGKFTIRAAPTSLGGNGIFEDSFEINNPAAAVSTQSNNGIFGDTKAYISEQVTNEIDKFKTKWELNEKNKEIAELKEQISGQSFIETAIQRYGDTIWGFIDKVVANVTGKTQVAIGGFQDNQNNDQMIEVIEPQTEDIKTKTVIFDKTSGLPVLSEKDAAKFNQAIIVLFKHDPELVDHLLKLSKMAEKNPGKFKTLLNFL